MILTTGCRPEFITTAPGTKGDGAECIVPTEIRQVLLSWPGVDSCVLLQKPKFGSVTVCR